MPTCVDCNGYFSSIHEADKHTCVKTNDLICCVKNCNREVEFANDEYPSTQCSYHNDRDIEHARERAEWNEYH